MQNLRMDLSFQEKKTVCNSVAWFTSYNSSRDMGEFLRFFSHHVDELDELDELDKFDYLYDLDELDEMR